MYTADESKLGGMKYPLMSRLGMNWTLQSFKLNDEADTLFMESVLDRGLAWVKDNQVNVLTVPGMSAEEIIRALQWQISFQKGPAVASKRISRILRPYRYGYEGKASDITIYEDNTKDAQVWDGIFQVSRRLVEMTSQYLTGISERSHKRFTKELHTHERWELTILTRGGELKGHAFVTDLPAGIDIVCPVGVAKHELAFTTDDLFIGLQAVHGSHQMKLDIQSLVNLLPFFGVDNLTKWLEQSTKYVLDSIRENETDKLASMLYSLESQEAINKLEYWPAGAYLVSGGPVKWFARTVRTAADQYKEQLRSQNEQMRFPIPGGGLYIAPASALHKTVHRGNALLDFKTASIYINDADWTSYATRNGGFDGDDRHWVVVFQDALDSKLKVLFWRSPNQYGEYIVAELQEGSDTTTWIDKSIPTFDTSKLPLPIERQGNSYGDIIPLLNMANMDTHYNLRAIQEAILQITENSGVLGMFCNICLVHVAVIGDGPHRLPARLEQVIDYTVKEIGDMSQVSKWIFDTADVLADYPIPAILAMRIANLTKKELIYTDDHDIDRLVEAMNHTMDWFTAEAEGIALAAMPPASIFERGRDYMHKASELKSVYGRFMRSIAQVRQPTAEDSAEAERLVRLRLDAYPKDEQPNILYGLAAWIYTVNAHKDNVIRDGVIWNAVGYDFLEVLRTGGLLADIEWTGKKAELYYNNPELENIKPVSAYMKQVWYQLYVLTTGNHIPMGHIGKDAQKLYKAKVSKIIPAMTGMKLELKDSTALSDRQVFIGPKGNEVAYLAADQLLPNGIYTLTSAVEDDGNLHAILVPEGASNDASSVTLFSWRNYD